MNIPTRKISHSDLSDKLRQLEKAGVNVPMLTPSNYSVDYVRTRDDDDVEVYKHGGKFVEVHRGEVIDSHGNVINLNELELKAMTNKYKETPVPEEYKDHVRLNKYSIENIKKRIKRKKLCLDTREFL